MIGEAAVNGCFQILSEIASREEVLGEGRYGSVVPVDDAQALADAMRRVSNEEVLFSGIHGEIAANARENLVWASLLKPVAKELQ